VRYDRDALVGITAVTHVETGADYPGRPGGVDPRPLVAQTSYLGRRRVSVTFANSAQTSTRYDGAGRIIEIRHAGQGGALLTLDGGHVVKDQG